MEDSPSRSSRPTAGNPKDLDSLPDSYLTFVEREPRVIREHIEIEKVLETVAKGNIISIVAEN